MYWDYLSQNPESIHQVMILFGDRGIPDGFRKMHGYYGHSLKLVQQNGEWVYAMFHMIAHEGFHYLTVEQAAELSNDYGTKDLFEAIDKGNFPKWDLKVQTMTKKQAEDLWAEKKINIFDLTHVWPQKEFPLRKIGTFTLNENPQNYFAEVEQVAFSELPFFLPWPCTGIHC